MKEEEEEKMAKIMLVDDAAFMRMMIKKALSASGYNDFIEAQDWGRSSQKNTVRKTGHGDHGYHHAKYGRASGFVKKFVR